MISIRLKGFEMDYIFVVCVITSDIIANIKRKLTLWYTQAKTSCQTIWWSVCQLCRRTKPTTKRYELFDQISPDHYKQLCKSHIDNLKMKGVLASWIRVHDGCYPWATRTRRYQWAIVEIIQSILANFTIEIDDPCSIDFNVEMFVGDILSEVLVWLVVAMKSLTCESNNATMYEAKQAVNYYFDFHYPLDEYPVEKRFPDNVHNLTIVKELMKLIYPEFKCPCSVYEFLTCELEDMAKSLIKSTLIYTGNSNISLKDIASTLKEFVDNNMLYMSLLYERSENVREIVDM